jgi:hypothetical protein
MQATQGLGPRRPSDDAPLFGGTHPGDSLAGAPFGLDGRLLYYWSLSAYLSLGVPSLRLVRGVPRVRDRGVVRGPCFRRTTGNTFFLILGFFD